VRYADSRRGVLEVSQAFFALLHAAPVGNW
jgi:hypothetical protein